MPADHPLRVIRLLVNEALVRLNSLFNTIYVDTGRAQQRHPCQSNQSQCALVPQKQPHRLHPALSGACADGKPDGAGVERCGHPCRWDGRTRGGIGNAGTAPGSRPKTVGTNKAYDTADFVANCRDRNLIPHVAQNNSRRGDSAIDARTTRHIGYQLSQMIRKRIEEHFGWGKTVGRIRQTIYLPRLAASRSALQAHHDCQQSRANRPNTIRGTAGSVPMSGKGAWEALRNYSGASIKHQMGVQGSFNGLAKI